ncbi:MAG: GTPase HflX [Geobacteraceae bacterium GWC2_55_20]|nr:MAG: GTPase HflX [Geobacteraceae bacterium GWC2_55_20]OGU26738.1 MAG: GTPase HflX [Geobacteraceae bacterium GWF2_54_21]HBA71738.1 GTPase HflX [Geobacter sp.]HCE67252.1 GTPase HflX [Geobacter sp.]
MKSSQIQALERLYRRRVLPAEICSHELATRLVELSTDLRRQIAILVNRSGIVEYVIVGDEKGLVIPELRDYPLGRRVMRGLRLIHTHLKNEPVSEDDLTDLSLLRLDLLATLMFTPGRQQISAQLAWLSPDQRGASTIVEPVKLFDRIDLDCVHFIDELEADLEKAARTTTKAANALERAILISVTTSGTRQEAEDSMAELRELARTAQVEALDEFIQRPRSLNPRFLMGEGKMRDVVIRALQHGASMLIFDQELTPAQIRSISAMTELKVIDRSQLILDIFARRAKTLDGKVQVELAQLKYLLPRLTGRGVQMSRLMGGIGGRGPGETKLETDRRRIRDRIASLERELKELSRGRDQRRQQRIKAGVPIISIVGYTNAGKSTLLNALTKSDVFTEDLLFATLDTSTRRLRFPREREVIITDTVGFIRSLPKSLMGAFKATLEELRDADLLLHVVDSSHPRFEDQIAQVRTILQELELGDKQELMVYNKSDLLNEMRKKDMVGFLRVRQSARTRNSVTVSARDRKSLAPLMDELQRRFWPEETEEVTL